MIACLLVYVFLVMMALIAACCQGQLCLFMQRRNRNAQSVMLLTALKSGVLVYSFFTILSGVSGRESKAQQGDPQRIVGQVRPLQLNVTPVSQGNNVPDRKDKTVPTCEMSKDYVKISHVEVLMTDM